MREGLLMSKPARVMIGTGGCAGGGGYLRRWQSAWREDICFLESASNFLAGKWPPRFRIRVNKLFVVEDLM